LGKKGEVGDQVGKAGIRQICILPNEELGFCPQNNELEVKRTGSNSN
jgi:hypothetical protein